MSRRIVDDIAANFDRVNDFYLQFLDRCPDALWLKTCGGWPVWQHVVHVYGSIELFTLQPGQEPASHPVPSEVIKLGPAACAPVNKTDARAYMEIMKTKADVYIAGLTDAALAEKNEGFSTRKQEHFTHAVTMGRLAAHGFYHFGTLDGALRDARIKGIH